MTWAKRFRRNEQAIHARNCCILQLLKLHLLGGVPGRPLTPFRSSCNSFVSRCGCSRGQGVSQADFRVLTHLGRTEGVSCSAAAERVGLSLPLTARPVDCFVARDFVRLGGSAEDRRRFILQLTDPGKELVRGSRASAQTRLAEALSRLMLSQRSETTQAMGSVRPIFPF
jgi:DNA-binding MarR family transcriptional regulator